MKFSKKQFIAILAIAVLVPLFYFGIDRNGIIGVDDRVSGNYEEVPWIGEISHYPDRKMGGACTASLLSPRLVLTSSHCTFHFSLFSTHSISKKWYFYSHHITDPQSEPISGKLVAWGGRHIVLGDWALILLDQPQTKVNHFPAFETNDPPDTADLKVSGDLWGHPADRATDGLFMHSSCQAWVNFLGFVETNCDSTQGMSGGPFVTYQNGKETIWSVNSMTFEVPFIKWNFMAPSSSFATVARNLISAESQNSIARFLNDHNQDPYFEIPKLF